MDHRADGRYLLLGLPVVQSLLFQVQSEVRDLLLQLGYKAVPAPEQSIIVTIQLSYMGVPAPEQSIVVTIQLSYKGVPATEQSIIVTILNYVSKQSRV